MSTSSQQSAEASLSPDQWVDEYGDFLFTHAHLRLRNRQEAEEVVQETFLAAYRAYDQFHGQSSVRGWLTGILKRKIVDQIRRRAWRERHQDGEQGELDGLLFDAHGRWRSDAFPDSARSDLETAEFWQVIRECLSRLPQGLADVFVLSAVEELPTLEICRILNITSNNVWVRMHRARLRLAHCVATKLGDAGEL